MKLFEKFISSYFILLISFTLLIICVHMIPQSAIRDNVAISTHTLEQEGLYKKFFNFKLFQMDNYTDSYMLNLAIAADNKNPIEAAMMNYAYKSSNYMNLAYDTENIANGNMNGLEKSSYGRYWQGYQITLRPLLTILSYPQIRILNYILFTLLIVIIIYCIHKYISIYVSVIFACSLLLINFPIVPYSMQFSTCFYIAFISMILIMRFPLLTNSLSNVLCTFFVIGGITSYFDFLTTPQLTLGLPLIIYMLIRRPENSWKMIILICITWGLGYGILWASKWLMGYLLTGNNLLVDAMKSAELRTSNLYKGMHMTIPNILEFIWNNIKAKGLMPMFYGGIVGILLCLAIYVRILKSKQCFKEYSWLLLVTMIVPVWFLILRNHSIQHGWFTWRAFLLPLFSLMLFIYYTTDIKKIFKK